MGWLISIILTVLIASVSIYLKQYIALFVILPLFIVFSLLAYARYKSGGYELRENQLTVVYRNFSKYTGIMRRRHVQAVGYNQSYFQRKDELCTTLVAVAGRGYEVKHMRKKIHFVYIIGTKKKETPVCNGVSFLCHDLSISR